MRLIARYSNIALRGGNQWIFHLMAHEIYLGRNEECIWKEQKVIPKREWNSIFRIVKFNLRMMEGKDEDSKWKNF